MREFRAATPLKKTDTATKKEKKRYDNSDGLQLKTVYTHTYTQKKGAHQYIIGTYEKCMFLSSRLFWLKIVIRYRGESLC